MKKYSKPTIKVRVLDMESLLVGSFNGSKENGWSQNTEEVGDVQVDGDSHTFLGKKSLFNDNWSEEQ